MPIDVPDNNLIEGTVTVSDPATGEDYRKPLDYHVDHADGTIIPTTAGDIDDGENLEISYQWQPEGRYEDPTFTGDPRDDATRTIQSLTTPGACEQAARRLVQAQSDATLRARIDLSALDPRLSTLRALSPPGLPEGADALPVDEIEHFGTSVFVRLGGDGSVDETIDRIRRGQADIERRV